ncbi:MAG TPA: 2'-5' RNA ligase family protein [Anaerolineae bacterium]|nr:2'-5' RNA ligase family protein [Anaerolineae bacterium]
MNDYRIFVGAFPEGYLADRIQAMRLQHDAKTAHITNPHVTMAGTYWRSGSPTPENEAHTIEQLCSIEHQLHPFEMKIGGIETFLPETAVIYLHIESTPELLAARRTMLDVIGRDKQRHFTPHLTLTMRLDQAKTEALLPQLRQTEWHTQRWSVTIEHLWLMQRGPSDPAWRYIHRIEMTG